MPNFKKEKNTDTQGNNSLFFRIKSFLSQLRSALRVIKYLGKNDRRVNTDTNKTSKKTNNTQEPVNNFYGTFQSEQSKTSDSENTSQTKHFPSNKKIEIARKLYSNTIGLSRNDEIQQPNPEINGKGLKKINCIPKRSSNLFKLFKPKAKHYLIVTQTYKSKKESFFYEIDEKLYGASDIKINIDIQGKHPFESVEIKVLQKASSSTPPKINIKLFDENTFKVDCHKGTCKDTTESTPTHLIDEEIYRNN